MAGQKKQQESVGGQYSKMGEGTDMASERSQAQTNLQFISKLDEEKDRTWWRKVTKKKTLRQEVGRRKGNNVMEKNCCTKTGWFIIKNIPHLLGLSEESVCIRHQLKWIIWHFFSGQEHFFLTPAGDQMVPWRMKMNGSCHLDLCIGNYHCSPYERVKFISKKLH